MSNPRISLIHPTGNPNSQQAAIALSEIGLLQNVITTIAYHPNRANSPPFSLLPHPISTLVERELDRRTWTLPSNVPLHIYPWTETLRLALMRTGLYRRLGLVEQRLIDWVYASLDRHVAQHYLQNIDAIYAYEDGAATTFHTAKQQGIFCIYELPILFYRLSQAIQAEELQRFPELAFGLQATKEPTWKLARKEQEVQLADHIFAPSSIVKKSLLDFGVRTEKVSVIPYGTPVDYFHPQPKTDNCFRALFLGREGPRKGVHYLLQAWQELRLPQAELLLIGIKNIPQVWIEQYKDDFRYIPSVPHSSLNAYYSTASVFVFPSLVEGLALVLLEAMACGIPIITTYNSGGSDIITDGVEGFIVPIRDVEALKEKLEWCYRHPTQLAEMGRAARRKAEQLTWGLYRKKLSSIIQELLKNRTSR